MVTDQFDALLKEFESFFNCSLKPDNNNSCLINLPNGLQIQIEPYKEGNLLIATRLGTIPASRYRDNVFREALKSNESSFPSQGMFGFASKAGMLYFFTLVDYRSVNKEKIPDILNPFIAKANLWFEAIKNGNVPSEQTGKTTAQSNIFGIR